MTVLELAKDWQQLSQEEYLQALEEVEGMPVLGTWGDQCTKVLHPSLGELVLFNRDSQDHYEY